MGHALVRIGKHLSYYPQRTIGLFNALTVYVVFKLQIEPEEAVLLFGLVNAALVLVYGERNTTSTAWLEDQQAYDELTEISSSDDEDVQ